jgi:hypothetical protein
MVTGLLLTAGIQPLESLEQTPHRAPIPGRLAAAEMQSRKPFKVLLA